MSLKWSGRLIRSVRKMISIEFIGEAKPKNKCIIHEERVYKNICNTFYTCLNFTDIERILANTNISFIP